jgi:type I restriction-modification system DNA methylase subunit
LDSNFVKWVAEMNALLQELSSARDDAVIEASMNVSFKMLELLTSENVDDAETIIGERILTLPNSERQDGWFQNHPWMAGAKSAFDLFDGHTSKIQAKFYWLRKRSSSNLVGAVHFTPNWEDHDYTRNENFKVGLDFFLTSDADGVIVALSNRGKVRVIELNSKLSNTQVQVLQNWWGLESLPLDELHAQIWESFRLQEVNSRFYRGVSEAFVQLHDSLVNQGRPEEDAKMFASRLLGRLIFVWFLRKMNLIDSSIGYFDASQDSGDYYRRALERLFFRTLNSRVDDRSSESAQIDLTTPYLNGGLFSPRADDWYGDETLTFPQDFFVDLYAHFDEFNFTTDESTPEYEQVAIDPEMLGRVFESLLASQIEETGEQARKAKGAFYTPREIVAYMCRESVREYLTSALAEDARAAGAISKLIDTADHEWAINGSNSKRDIPKELQDRIGSALRGIKTIDPACGSGAFPLGLLQLLTKLQLRLDSRLDNYKLKLSILQDNIFGSDIEPMAVEISRLRSWLSLIVEEQGRTEIQPLPNLEFNFVCANSLAKLKDETLFTDAALQSKLAALREKFFATSDPQEKAKLQQNYLDAISPDLFDEGIDERGGQLKTYNPFDSETVSSFFDAEYMFGISEGFDIVIGNPPYVKKEHFTPAQIRSLEDNFSEKLEANPGRYRAWSDDLYVHFVFQGFELVKPGGVVNYITNDSFLGLSSKKRVRDLFAEKSLVEIVSCPPETFDATIYTAIFLARNAPSSATAYRASKFSYPEYTLVEMGFVHFDFVSQLPGSRLVFSENQIVSKLLSNARVKDWLVIKDTGIHSGNCRSKVFFEGPSSRATGKLLQGRQIVRWAVNWDSPSAQYKYCDPSYVPQAIPGVGRGGKPSSKLEYWGFVGDVENHFQPQRLLLRQTSDHLLAALEEQMVDGQHFTDNTLFSIFPRELGDLKYFLGVLNSKLINYVYQYLSAEEGKALAQVKTALVETLPMVYDVTREPEVVTVVEKLVEARRQDPNADVQALESELDRVVADIFELTSDERSAIGIL